MVRQKFTKLMSAVLMVAGLYWLNGQSRQSQPAQEASGSKLTQFAISEQPTSLYWQPQGVSGKVIAIPTGDSLVVLVGKKQMQLRLCGIDAPELTQPTGKTAQIALQKLLIQDEVRFVPVRQQSQQTIAEVFVPARLSSQGQGQSQGQSKSLFVNGQIVEAGFACVYAPYIDECPNRRTILQAQTTAQQRHQGIWAGQIQRPWDYRRQQVVRQLAQKPDPLKALNQISPTYLRDGMQQTTLGLASWYGSVLHGRLTANGEKFNQNALTAAHASLPFNTRLKVTNLQNGKSVIVRINDHQPMQQGSTLDLSKAAAQQIDSVKAGVVPVEMEILKGR